jgi:hypothetical protein
VIIDERILEYRNAIAHGSKRLRSGDELDLGNPDLLSAIDETRDLIRETKTKFQNALVNREFLEEKERGEESRVN